MNWARVRISVIGVLTQSPSHSLICAIACSARAALLTSTISLRPANSTLAKTGVPSSMVVTKACPPLVVPGVLFFVTRSEEHTSELQSLMRISYAVFCLKKKNITRTDREHYNEHPTTNVQIQSQH